MLGTEQVVFRNTFRIDAVPLLSKIPVLGPILFQKAYVTTYLGILVLIVTASSSSVPASACACAAAAKTRRQPTALASASIRCAIPAF